MSAIEPMPAAKSSSISFIERWWTYQRERFPIVGHGLLIAAFSFCAVSLSRMLRHTPGWPDWPFIVVAFGTCFTFFLQLRIADEFKDFEEDLRYRPYRPVQRGLVTLRSLGFVFLFGAMIQLALALWLNPKLVPLLGIIWVYLAAMSKEFFVADWLRRRPVLYMTSHMAIMPLVDLYATSADWLTAEGRAPRGLIWFLLASYFNGLVIEIGRKIRSPMDEEDGVATYSRQWGRDRAVLVWIATIVITAAFAMVVAMRLGHATAVGIVLSVAGVFAVAIAARFCAMPIAGRGKAIEKCAGLWTLTLYLSLGLLPHFLEGGLK